MLRRSGSADGLVLVDVPKPAPEPNEVLARVHAATVPRKDHPEPRVRRTEASVGALVSRFREGERVFGTTTGLSSGSYAEYICVPEQGVLATVPPTAPMRRRLRFRSVATPRCVSFETEM